MAPQWWGWYPSDSIPRKNRYYCYLLNHLLDLVSVAHHMTDLSHDWPIQHSASSSCTRQWWVRSRAREGRPLGGRRGRVSWLSYCLPLSLILPSSAPAPREARLSLDELGIISTHSWTAIWLEKKYTRSPRREMSFNLFRLLAVSVRLQASVGKGGNLVTSMENNSNSHTLKFCTIYQVPKHVHIHSRQLLQPFDVLGGMIILSMQ